MKVRSLIQHDAARVGSMELHEVLKYIPHQIEKRLGKWGYMITPLYQSPRFASLGQWVVVEGRDIHIMGDDRFRKEYELC